MPKRRRQDSDASSRPSRRVRHSSDNANDDTANTTTNTTTNNTTTNDTTATSNTASNSTPAAHNVNGDDTARSTSAFHSRVSRLQHDVQQQQQEANAEQPNLSEDALYAQSLAGRYLREDILRGAIDEQIRVLMTNLEKHCTPKRPRYNGKHDGKSVPYHRTKRGMDDERFIKMMCEDCDLEGYPIARPGDLAAVPRENVRDGAEMEDGPATGDEDEDEDESGTEG